MPRLSVWMVHSSLIYLIVGFSIGAALLVHKGVALNPAFMYRGGYALWNLLPAHIEFLMFGWIVNLIFGVAYWILPRFSLPPRRGNTVLAVVAFGLLNFGIILSAVSPFLKTLPWLVILGRAFQVGGVLAFVLHAWPRVKAARIM
jgi:hypothetical protein